jgi:ribonuclease VapC
MIVDSSALVAILTGEPDADFFVRVLRGESLKRIPTVVVVETSIVLTRSYGDAALAVLLNFLVQGAFRTVPLEMVHAQEAMLAFLKFGKGRHPAQLNFADCFVYGTALVLGEPVLCKGNDFAQTDIHFVRPPNDPA